MEKHMINLENKLNEFINKFLNNINSLSIDGFEFSKPKSDHLDISFPILELTDKAQEKNLYQQKMLEWLVRDLLVNETLNYLFKSHGYEIRWRLKSCMTTGGYSNEENETIFPIEFVLIHNNENIAFRYSNFYDFVGNIVELSYDDLMLFNLPENKVDKFYYIDWSNKDDIKISKTKNYPKELYNRIYIEDFFTQYFSTEEFSLVIQKLKTAVNKANIFLGFHTIPRLLSNNISLFRENVLQNILVTDFEELPFYFKKSVNHYEKILMPDLLNNTELSKLNENFFVNDRYISLIGNSDFAESFITSEYLYRIFENNQSFDYTSIVSGYFKCIEQLCSHIVSCIIKHQYNPQLIYLTRDLTNDEEKTLRANKQLVRKDLYTYVYMKKENEQFFYQKELTMGELFYFFKYNRFVLFKSFTANKGFPFLKIYDLMINYLNMSRNGYFHKHNIHDFKEVERIKSNTYFLLYWILGSIDLTNNLTNDLSLLETVDTSFERLFRKLYYKSEYRFIIKFKDHIEHKVIRIRESCNYHFDSQGRLTNAHLLFTEVNEFNNNVVYSEFIENLSDKTPTYTINEQFMPSEIYYIESNGNRIKINF